MNRLIKFFSVTLFLIFTVQQLYSQTLDEFSKQVDEEFADFDKETDEEFETFKKEVDQSFNEFVAKIDKEFSDYLSENFEAYDIGNDKFDVTKPKPDIIPVVEEIEVKDDFIDFQLIETIVAYQGPVYPGIKKTETEDFDTQKINVKFLGWPLYFHIDGDFTQIVLENLSAEAIANNWNEYGKLNYNHFLYQISDVANTLNLNQWGYFQLLNECSQQVYPEDKNMQVFFQWAMLSRSRYKVKIGFTKQQLFLLIPSVYKMYNIDFVKVNGINYYVIDGNGEPLQTYEKDFPETDILMDVSIKKPFYTDPIKKSKQFKFSYNKKDYSLKLEFDEQMIKFYQTIPLSDISIYFNSVVSDRTKNSIQKSFEPVLKGKSDAEAANILLQFVQQAFDYKTDQQVFGREKYFFPDELLHYPYADCEDRSVLYAYLVKTLLNKEVVALGFPGHMATAINLGQKVEGAKVEYNNKIFVIADPTLLGAGLGALMPSVRGDKVELIAIANTSFKSEIALLAWEKTNNSGGFKASIQRDIVFDEQGNIYVCGYFSGTANFDDQILQGTEGDRDVFVVKYDKDLKVIWARAANGVGNDMAFSMALGEASEIYLYGSFENDLSFDGKEIVAVDAPDVFVAKYSDDGEIVWAKKAGIDKIDHRLDFMFAAKFNPEGEKIMAKLYSQVEDFNYYGIELDKEGNASIKGSFFATTGMSSNDFVNYNFEGDLTDVPNVLYKTDKKLKEKEYEATIAGLFAALNLLKANTVEIQGSNIKDAFDTYNKSFKNYASGFYENLKDMKFLKNEKGIVSIKTSDGEPIFLDKIKINNDARIRIVKYKSGNILVEVLSGIYVGGGNYWLDMNSIKLFKESGDLLFNFDTDNSVKKLNLKNEILKH